MAKFLTLYDQGRNAETTEISTPSKLSEHATSAGNISTFNIVLISTDDILRHVYVTMLAKKTALSSN
jgi:hypothetical protein